jgi:enterochelin esterase-like enzyme
MQRYPVLYLLHSFGHDAWTEVGKTAAIMDNLIAQQACEEMIVLIPNSDLLPVPNDTKFDGYAPKNLKLMERDLLEDLRPYITQNYQLSSHQIHNAIAGLSMGGGQALTIALRHLDSFARVASFSSAAP